MWKMAVYWNNLKFTVLTFSCHQQSISSSLQNCYRIKMFGSCILSLFPLCNMISLAFCTLKLQSSIQWFPPLSLSLTAQDQMTQRTRKTKFCEFHWVNYKKKKSYFPQTKFTNKQAIERKEQGLQNQLLLKYLLMHEEGHTPVFYNYLACQHTTELE